MRFFMKKFDDDKTKVASEKAKPDMEYVEIANGTASNGQPLEIVIRPATEADRVTYRRDYAEFKKNAPPSHAVAPKKLTSSETEFAKDLSRDSGVPFEDVSSPVGKKNR